MAVSEPGEAQELAALRAEVPTALLDDYLAGRARNHAVNRCMVEWAAAGVFDYLILPQDDTVAYGWNSAESRQLRQLVRELGLAHRVSIYPGTDETAMLLLARYVAQQAGLRPHVWLRYSGSGAEQIITAYEDRPMTEMVKAHLGPLGGVLVDQAADADLLLYVNAPAEGQGDGPEQYVLLLTDAQLAALPEPARKGALAHRRRPQAATTLRELHTVRRDLPEFVHSLAEALEAGRTCAVVDVAFVNAGDMALGDLLAQEPRLSQLAAYGGWNTAGNTLAACWPMRSSVIFSARAAQRLPPWRRTCATLFLRLVEDYLSWRACERRSCWKLSAAGHRTDPGPSGRARAGDPGGGRLPAARCSGRTGAQLLSRPDIYCRRQQPDGHGTGSDPHSPAVGSSLRSHHGCGCAIHRTVEPSRLLT